MSKFGKTMKYLINRAPERPKLELPSRLSSAQFCLPNFLTVSSHSFSIELSLRQDTDSLSTSKRRSLHCFRSHGDTGGRDSSEVKPLVTGNAH